MIGMAMRLAFGGGDNCCMWIIMGLAAVCAIFGLYKCMSCRMRDCRCIKRILRSTGVDTFDDFDLTIIVHQAFFTSKQKTFETAVRVTAGLQVCETDPSKEGIFQQPLEVLVEQGTEEIVVELIDVYNSQACAAFSWDPAKDILEAEHEAETLYPLKITKGKEVINPRVKMSLFVSNGADDEEKALMPNLGVSVETNLMLSQQIKKVLAEEEHEGKKSAELSELEVLVKGTAGPLELYESWGSTRDVWVAVRGPPETRYFRLGIWEHKEKHEKGEHPELDVNLLKVLSIAPDPSRPEVFTIAYVDDAKIRQRLTFKRLDRNRDVWVEMLRVLIEMIRKDKEHKRRKRNYGAGPASQGLR